MVLCSGCWHAFDDHVLNEYEPQPVYICVPCMMDGIHDGGSPLPYEHSFCIELPAMILGTKYAERVLAKIGA